MAFLGRVAPSDDGRARGNSSSWSSRPPRPPLAGWPVARWRLSRWSWAGGSPRARGCPDTASPRTRSAAPWERRPYPSRSRPEWPAPPGRPRRGWFVPRPRSRQRAPSPRQCACPRWRCACPARRSGPDAVGAGTHNAASGGLDRPAERLSLLRDRTLRVRGQLRRVVEAGMRLHFFARQFTRDDFLLESTWTVRHRQLSSKAPILDLLSLGRCHRRLSVERCSRLTMQTTADDDSP